MTRLAIYPGSFDPPTIGHLDVIERASRLFENLIVAVGVNSSKTPLLTTEQRLEALRLSVAHIPNVKVESFSGLLIDYVHSKNSRAIIRGLRATADFEYEFQMALMNRRLASDIETVFLMTTSEHSYLSSSMVREVAQLGGKYTELVPEPVAKLVEEALKSRATP